MEVRNFSGLPYAADTENQRAIDFESPELVFIMAAAEGDTEKALSLFKEEKLFGGKSAVDAPYGRFEGLDAIRGFVENFRSVFHADDATVWPIVQTYGGGRCVSEIVIDFEVDGMINETAMFVVGDLRTQSTLDEVRIYCNFTHVPGMSPYRKPIFKSAHLEAGDPGLLTGSVREYYEALHHMPHVEPDRILKSMQPDCKFGGYEMFGQYVENTTPQHVLREAYDNMATYIPAYVGMRYETIIDDGTTCVIEWQHIISNEGREKGNRVATAGISAYERGADGLLCSIRICDYAWQEAKIDWSTTGITKEEAYAINAVDVMPDSVGTKKI